MEATDNNVFANAEVRTKESMNHKVYGLIQKNLDLLFASGNATDDYKENIKTVFLVFNLQGDYIYVTKVSRSQGYDSKPSYFKIARTEFDAIAA